MWKASGRMVWTIGDRKMYTVSLESPTETMLSSDHVQGPYRVNIRVQDLMSMLTAMERTSMRTASSNLPKPVMGY